MTIAINVKGYVNGDNWGSIELLSYEQIIAMTRENALTELNSNPSGYYNKLNSEGHLIASQRSDSLGLLGIGENNQMYAWDYSTLVNRPPQSGTIETFRGISYNNGVFAERNIGGTGGGSGGTTKK